MPKKEKNTFTEGMYGLDSAYDQSNKVYSLLKTMIPEFDKEIQELSNSGVIFLNKNVKPPKNSTVGIAEHTMAGSFTKEASDKNLKNMNIIRGKLKKRLNDPPEGMNKFYGYFYLCDKLLDTEAGDFGQAVSENAYLDGLLNQFQNGPIVGGRISVEDSIKYLDSVNPVTKKKETGPLNCLNKFFYITSRLLQREYDKQKINADYTPEKEKQYLNKLNADFKSMLANHDKLSKFVKPDGTSDYDAYLQNRLDTMTRKDIDNHNSRRTAQAQIENIRGQQRAIENGWGMNELDFAGKVSELTWYIEIERKILENQINPVNVENSININNKRVIDYNKKASNAEAKRADLEKELESLKKSKASKKIIESKQAEYEEQKNNAVSAAKRAEEVKRDAERNLQSIEETKIAYKSMTELYNGLKSINEEVKNTKINRISDKIMLTEKFEKLVKTHMTTIPATIKPELKKALSYTEKVMEYGGLTNQPIKISQDIIDSTMTEADIELYSDFASQFSVMSGWLASKPVWNYAYPNIGLQLQADMSKKLKGVDEHILDEKKFYSRRNESAAPFMKYDIEEKDSRTVGEMSTLLSSICQDALSKMTGESYDFKRSMRITASLNEVESGSMLKAMGDRTYLFNFFSQAAGNSPEAFSEKFSTREAAKRLKENRVLEYYNDFSNAGYEFFNVEFDKQRMEKTGWNDEKERLYLAKLDEVFDKNINAFEKMMTLPLEVQEMTGYMGNSVGHATGNDSSGTSRDIMGELTGLKWMKEGIRLGYSSKDLYVLSIAGKIEGNIRRGKCKILNKIEKYEKNLKDAREKLEYGYLSKKEMDKLNRSINSYEKNIQLCKELYKAATEFEEQKFKPLKESILGRKIESPKDVIKTIVQLEDFYDTYKNTKPLNGSNGTVYQNGFNVFADTIDTVKDKMFPDTINNCLKEIEAIKKNGKKPGIDRSFKYADKHREMSSFLTFLKNDELNDKEVMKAAASAYINNMFLHGMNEDAHPEYFNNKHEDFHVSNRRLKVYSDQYADRLIEIIQPKSAKDLAFALEFGNHNDILADMKSKITADASKGRLEAFIKGKPERYKNHKTIEEAVKDMKNSKAALKSSSGLYDEIVKGLERLHKMKEELSRELQEQYGTSHNIKVIGYEKGHNGKPDPSQPIYEITGAKEVKPDPQKLKAYLEKQEQVYSMMNRYLDNKNKIIRDRGGKANTKTGSELLGTNGAKRYSAMSNARNSLIILNRATKEFAEHGITNAERFTTRQPGFDINKSEYLKSDQKLSKNEEQKEYEKYIAGEKARFEENLKYNILEQNKSIKENLSKDIEKQSSEREKLWNKYKSIPNPTEADKKAFEDKIYNSALKTVYSELINNHFKDKVNDMFKKRLNEDEKVVEQNYKNLKESEKKYKDVESSYNMDYNSRLEWYADAGMNIPAKEKAEFNKRKKMVDDLKKDYDQQKKVYEDLKKNHEVKMRAFNNGGYPADALNTISTKDIMTINEGLKNGISRVVNKNPKEFDNFVNEVMNNDPFKNEFKKRILKESQNKSLNQKDIFEIRDDILKASAVKNKNKPENLAKIDKLSGVLGSNVNSKNAIKEAQKQKKVENAAKNAEKAAGRFK